MQEQLRQMFGPEQLLFDAFHGVIGFGPLGHRIIVELDALEL